MVEYSNGKIGIRHRPNIYIYLIYIPTITTIGSEHSSYHHNAFRSHRCHHLLHNVIQFLWQPTSKHIAPTAAPVVTQFPLQRLANVKTKCVHECAFTQTKYTER